MNDYEYHLFEEVRSGRMSRRELIRRATVAGLGAATIGTILAGAGSAGAAAPQPLPARRAMSPTRGGTARFGVTTPAADVDPVTLFTWGATVTAQLAGEYLCFPDADYNLEPRLATEWSASAPDTWTFKIRQGVTFHDGSPLTVDDVVATFDRLTDPEVNSAALSAFRGILSFGNVERVDDETVTFHLDRGYVDFPYLTSAFNYNTIVLPQDYEIGDFTAGGVGTGPFILQVFDAATRATYVRNPDYWDPEFPYLDAVEVRYYDDNAPIVLALQAGDIDVYSQTPVQGSQALFADEDITVLEASSSSYHPLHMRTDQAPFDDKRVRQAVAACLDRPAVVEILFGGRADLGNDHAFAPVYPAAAQATSDVPQRSQDYDLARQLLADAGYEDGFEIELTTAQFLELPQYAQVIQQQCRPAGIEVTLNIQDQTTFYGSGESQPWLVVPFGIVSWAARGSASQTIAPAYLSESVPAPDLSNSGGAWNSAHWASAEFDELVFQFDQELDEQKRLAVAAEAAALQHDEVPAVITYWQKDVRTTGANVHGLAAGPALHVDAREVYLDES
jgi:peptide/nickel transport system substrate-binding protein